MLPDGGHLSVLCDEVLDYLKPHSGGIFMDGTLGSGGHTLALLNALDGNARVIGLDQDTAALERSKKRLAEYEGKVSFYHTNFCDFAEALKQENISKVDGILLDLGVSSNQLDDAERGFSFRYDAPLDMRMNQKADYSAYDLVNTAGEEELADIIYHYGEERYSRRIARKIVEARSRQPIKTTFELADLIRKAYPKRHYYRIDPATRSFQAIRIAVNRELDVLKSILEEMVDYLNPGGTVCIISFHSLEDRIVKHTFRDLKKKGVLEVLTKKPITSAIEELERNRRARSAKLRVAKRSLQS